MRAYHVSAVQIFRVNKGLVLPQVSSAYATKQRAQRLARWYWLLPFMQHLRLQLFFFWYLGSCVFRISEAVKGWLHFTADGSQD